MANEVAKKETFSLTLTEGLNENKDALPAEFNIARFVQNSVALLNGNDMLAKYAKEHGTSPIKAGLLRGAYLGLDALNGEFHLVPYGATLNFMLDFKGVTKLMKKYSIKPIEDIFVEIVRQGDEYSRWSEDGVQHYKFEPKPFNMGTVTGAFGVCRFKDGTTIIEEMPLSELEKVRSKSKQSNGMAWKDFTTEMYKKTVIHRMRKRVPLDFDNAEQKDIFDEDGAIDTKTNNPQVQEVPDVEEIVVESTVIEPEPQEEVAEKVEGEIIEGEQIELPDFLKG